MPDRSAELLLWLLGVPAAILAAVYLLGPIGVLLIGRVRRNPTSIPFDPQQTPAPPEVQNVLDRAAEALRPEGFEPVSHVVLPDMIPDAKIIAVMLVRRPDEVQALINVSVGTVGSQTKIQDRCIEFVTAFADGTEHHTLWNLVSPPIPRLPSKSILQVDSDDAAFLWRVHRRYEGEPHGKNAPAHRRRRLPGTRLPGDGKKLDRACRDRLRAARPQTRRVPPDAQGRLHAHLGHALARLPHPPRSPQAPQRPALRRVGPDRPGPRVHVSSLRRR
jgi:hypothetical protein